MISTRLDSTVTLFRPSVRASTHSCAALLLPFGLVSIDPTQLSAITWHRAKTTMLHCHRQHHDGLSLTLHTSLTAAPTARDPQHRRLHLRQHHVHHRPHRHPGLLPDLPYLTTHHHRLLRAPAQPSLNLRLYATSCRKRRHFEDCIQRRSSILSRARLRPSSMLSQSSRLQHHGHHRQPLQRLRAKKSHLICLVE